MSADEARGAMIGFSAAFAVVGAVALASMVNNVFIMRDYGRDMPLGQVGYRRLKLGLVFAGMAVLALSLYGSGGSGFGAILYLAHLVLYGVVLYDYLGRPSGLNADKIPGARVKQGLLIAGIIPLGLMGLSYGMVSAGAGVMADNM